MSDNKHIKASIIRFDTKEVVDYKGKKCVVPISVGQPAHEGKKFEATIALINKYFSSCIILVCHTLQRHSMAILQEKKSSDDLYDFSQNEGEKWIKRNMKYIRQLKIENEISNWNQWLDHKQFKDYKQHVDYLYANNMKYAQSINESVENYIIRLNNREDVLNYDRAIEFSHKYIKEECAAMSLCVIEKKYDCILYPTLIQPVDETIKHLIKKDQGKKFFMLGIRFKKHKMNDCDNSNYNLEHIINNIPGHIYWKDKNGKFLGCNLKQALSYGAKNLGEIINKTDSDLIGEKLGSKIRENDLSIIKTGKTTIIEEDILIHGKQSTMISHKSPFIDTAGDIVGVFGISVDISEQKHKERQLSYINQLSSVTLANVMAKMPGHVYWKNTQGIYLGCNEKQAHSLGVKSYKEIIGKTDEKLPWGKNEASKIREHDKFIMNTGKAEIIEEPVVIKNKKFVFLSHKSPLKDNEGNTLGVMGVSIDITHQKKLEKNLLAQTKRLQTTLDEKKRFLNNLSHEIRTPLHVIQSISNELYKNIDYLSKEETHSFLETLVENNERLMNLLTNLLEIAKGFQKKNMYKFETRNLLEIINSCVREVKKTAIIEVNSNIKSIMLKCDDIKISQVIRNLLDNAIKYGDATTIIISIEKCLSSKSVVVTIADKGIGIPDQEKEKVFEPFYQCSNNRKGDGGTGLGLSICKEIIEAHKGNIWIDKDKLEMTNVNIKLPCKE